MSQLQTVEAYVIDSIKAEQLPGEIPGCPLNLDARRLILANVPVVFHDPQTQEAPEWKQLALDESEPNVGYDIDATAIAQPSAAHVRSFELLREGSRDQWHDEFGNVFASFSLKGNNFSRPQVLESPTATDGFVAWGLQESKVIERTIRASKVLRAKGVSTEYIIGLAEPKTYPWPDIDGATIRQNTYSLRDYKQRIIHDHWTKLPEDERTIDNLAAVTRPFSDMTFYVSLRATDSAYRLGDTKYESQRALVYEEVNKMLQPGDERFTDPASDDQYKRYLKDYVAPAIGANLAKVHEDTAHRFLHVLNITAHGGIVDLDSLHGEPLGLGDEPITDQDRAIDFFQVLLDIDGLENGVMRVFGRSSHAVARSFAEHYIRETRELLGTDEAINRIASVIEQIETLETGQNRVVDDAIVNGLIRTLKMAYLDELFDNQASTRDISVIHDTLWNDIQEFKTDEKAHEIIVEKLRAQLPLYANAIASDFMNELFDPDFDIVAAFLATPLTETRALLIEQADLGIMHAFNLLDDSDVIHLLPHVTSPVARRYVYEAIANDYAADFAKITEQLIDGALLYLKDDLYRICDYESPESVVPQHESLPNVGDIPQKLWLSTEDVPFGDIVALLRKGSTKCIMQALPPVKKPSYAFPATENQQTIQQVVTDGVMDGYSIENGPNRGTITLEFQTKKDSSACSYILFIESDENQELLARLFVADVVQAQEWIETGQEPELVPAPSIDTLF